TAGGIGDDALAGAAALPQDPLTRAIAGLQARLQAEPADAGSWALLGFAYVQQARVTADPSYYPRAEGALRRALALKPDGNAEALAGLGAPADARHGFARAVDFGAQAEANE